jgi:hypothetical protein
MIILDLFFCGARLGIVVAGVLYGFLIASCVVWFWLWLLVESVGWIWAGVTRRRGQ